ncbi:MAG: RecX family transcriptional regulator [Thiotrichales bacterium]
MRYAEEYTRVRIQKGYGPVRIDYELRQRGVAAEVAAAALALYREEWPARAQAALSKRFGAVGADRAVRAQQHRFLESRGFPAGVIRDALGRY